MSLEGSKVVVVGGSSGMGFAIAKAATVQGAQVLVASRSVEKLNFAAASIGDGLTTHVVDLLGSAALDSPAPFCVAPRLTPLTS